MRKILSLLLVPLLSLVIFLASYTPVYACDYDAPLSFAPNSQINFTVNGASGTFYIVTLKDAGSNIVSTGGGGIDVGETTGTLTITTPATTGSYTLEVTDRPFGTGSTQYCTPRITTLNVCTGCSTVSNPNAPAELGSIVLVIRNIIKLLVPVAAIAFFIMMIIGGAQFIFSGGDPKAAAGARSTLTYAIIGIILVVVSWLILLLVQNVTGVDVTKVFIPGITE